MVKENEVWYCEKCTQYYLGQEMENCNFWNVPFLCSVSCPECQTNKYIRSVRSKELLKLLRKVWEINWDGAEQRAYTLWKYFFISEMNAIVDTLAVENEYLENKLEKRSKKLWV